VTHDHKAVTAATELAPGDRVDVRLARGSIEAEVVAVRPAEP
jgi:ribosomal 50S subunit-recycling heat shock protein